MRELGFILEAARIHERERETFPPKRKGGDAQVHGSEFEAKNTRSPEKVESRRASSPQHHTRKWRSLVSRGHEKVRTLLLRTRIACSARFNSVRICRSCVSFRLAVHSIVYNGVSKHSRSRKISGFLLWNPFFFFFSSNLKFGTFPKYFFSFVGISI